MSDNQSPAIWKLPVFEWAWKGDAAQLGESAPLADYHLTDEELAEREAFIAGMVHVDDLLDFEDYSDPDASYISYLETKELYERDGLLS